MANLDQIQLPDNTSHYTKTIFRGETGSTSTSTAFVVTVSGITSLYDGLTVVIKNATITSASGCTLNVSGTGAKRIWVSYSNTGCTTHWALNQTYLFIYDLTNDRWELQSGRDRDTNTNTWRGIQVNGTQLLGTGTSTGAVNFKSGTNCTVSGSGHDITFTATDTTYESKTAASGGTDLSLCTTGEKYIWNNKMDKANPTGTGYFSLNRAYGSTVGTNSFAEGDNTTASGDSSHSEGYYTTADGDSSHAEGSNTNANGDSSHTEGYGTTASGDCSHAEGYGTTANHAAQHVFGEYNIADPSSATSSQRGNYVEIVGNGTSTSARSNARTLDWDGNETLAGKLSLANTTIDVTEADNGVSSDTYTRLLFTDGSSTTASYGISSVSSAAYADGHTSTFINCRNYTTSGTVADNNYLSLHVDKNGTASVSVSHRPAWRQALAIGGLKEFKFDSWHNGFVFRADANYVYVFVPGWYGDTSGTISTSSTATVQWKGLMSGTFTASSLTLSNVVSRTYGTEFQFTRPSTVSNNATGIVGFSGTVSWTSS